MKKQSQNDDQFTEHFSQKLLSGIARNGVSRHQDFKIFWESMFLDPPCQILIWLGLYIEQSA